MTNNQNKYIKDYQIEDTIGEGTFGKVKLGTHIPTKNKVAVKILKKSKLKGREDLKRLLREMEIIKTFDHTNIIGVYEVKNIK
jgi:5'-AMP-activated protein kinase catalytic alpha subunit